MEKAQIYTIIALCIYEAIMGLIGCLSYSKSKTLDGFFVGGILGWIENLRNFESLPEDPNPISGTQLTDILSVHHLSSFVLTLC